MPHLHQGGILVGNVRVGLALSGGTAKSVAHIGVIKALIESGIEISYLSGTSGGSIIAVLYAAGKTVEELSETAGGIGWRKLAGLTLPKLGFLSGDKIRDFIVSEIGDLAFDDLEIPTAVVVADLTTGSKRVLREGKVALACQASSSIPEIYEPVEIDGHCLVDGGLIEYLPVETLAGFGEMFKIGVNLSMREGFQRKPRHLLEVVMQVTGFVSFQNAAASERMAEFVIKPRLARFSPFALDRASDIIDEGYRATLQAIPELQRALRSYGSLIARLMRRLPKR
jgi:NTE family protein